MQQDASNKLGMNAKKTMSVAQKLYEGIDLDSETVGLITYMRTDSTRLSDEFVKNTYKYIENTYGKEYKGYVKQTKKKYIKLLLLHEQWVEPQQLLQDCLKQ